MGFNLEKDGPLSHGPSQALRPAERRRFPNLPSLRSNRMGMGSHTWSPRDATHLAPIMRTERGTEGTWRRVTDEQDSRSDIAIGGEGGVNFADGSGLDIRFGSEMLLDSDRSKLKQTRNRTIRPKRPFRTSFILHIYPCEVRNCYKVYKASIDLILFILYLGYHTTNLNQHKKFRASSIFLPHLN